MQQDNNQKYIIVATLSFIVGFGLAWLITANRLSKYDSIETISGTETETATDTESETAASTLNTNDLLVVADQKSGTEVEITKAVLVNSGWVVIHEDDNGKPGKILGAQLFDPGTWSGKVELLRGTMAGKIYYAMVHNDNGDRAFDPKKDLPTTEEAGAPIMTTFRTLDGINDTPSYLPTLN